MEFYAAFHSISVISRRQLTLFMFSWVSPVLGWALKCFAQGHSHKKPRGSSAAQTQDPWITSQTIYHSPAGPFGKEIMCINFIALHYIIAGLFTTQSQLLMTLKKRALENMVGKEKMLVTSIFSFSHCFLLYQREKLSFNPFPNNKF